MRRVVVLVCMAMLAIVLVRRAEASGRTDDVLGGLTGVKLVMSFEHGDVPLATTQVSQELLENDCKLQLMQSGVRLLDDEEWKAAPGSPSLWVMVMLLQTGEKGQETYCYSVQVALREGVLLTRGTKRWWLGTTWESTGQIGLLGYNKIGLARQKVHDEVDQFLTAYLSENQPATRR